MTAKQKLCVSSNAVPFTPCCHLCANPPFRYTRSPVFKIYYRVLVPLNHREIFHCPPPPPPPLQPFIVYVSRCILNINKLNSVVKQRRLTVSHGGYFMHNQRVLVAPHAPLVWLPPPHASHSPTLRHVILYCFFTPCWGAARPIFYFAVTAALTEKNFLSLTDEFGLPYANQNTYIQEQLMDYIICRRQMSSLYVKQVECSIL